MVLILSSFGMALSLVGNIFVMFKKRIGWIIWLISNIFWILVNIFGDFNLPMVLMYIFYMAINIQGFIKWSKDKKNIS